MSDPAPNWKASKLADSPGWTDDFLRDRITNGKMKPGMAAWDETGPARKLSAPRAGTA